MSEIRVNNLSNESNTGGPTITGITTFSGTNFFVPPVGNTAQRPENPQGGDLRFNTDTKHLEYFRGDTIGWSEVEASHGQLGGGTGSNAGTGTRGLAFGGNPGSSPNLRTQIDYITISTLGNSADFGDCHTAMNQSCAFGNSKRGVGCGGNTASSPYGNNDTYMTIFASLGDATDFYTLTATTKEATAFANEVRGFCNEPAATQIAYVDIESGGNFVDFGVLTATSEQGASYTSSTRGIVHINQGTSNVINYVTLMTLGDAIDFGDASDGRYGGSGGSSATRGLFAGGWAPNVVNIIDYVQIATTGNSLDFGDLTDERYGMHGSCSSKTRMVHMGGHTNPGPQINVMDYNQFATKGNALDFGDFTGVISSTAACSNGHGGL